MKVLLVSPQFPYTFWSFTYALSFIGKKAAFPPLGLLTVAALLPEEWPRRLVDVNVESLSDSDLLPALIAWRRGKNGCVFFTEASINLADDPELLNLMVLAGFDSVFIGIESPDELSLVECHKIQNKNRDLLACVNRIHRSGMQVMGGFIVGFDSDLPSIFQRQIDFIQKSGIVIAMVGMLQAPPGTRLFDRLQRESRINDTFSGDNVDGTPNILPRMGLDLLVDGYRSIMQEIYSPKNYYRRVQTLLRELKAPEINQPLNLQRLLSFFRSTFRLGFLGKERFHYWGLLLWTLSRRPRLVPTAVTLSIYGYHYRKICELYIYRGR